jgi:Tol biopolymer transport system component
VSAQSQSNSTVQVLPGGKAAAVREITRGATRNDGQGGLDWIDDRTVVYTMIAGGSAHLWAGWEGFEPRQLTFGGEAETDPSGSVREGAVYYVTGHDTLPCIWRMKADGSNPVRLTFHEDYNPDISPDGRWLLFDSWRSGARSIWKLPIGTADTATMFRHGGIEGRFSPDGRLVACWVHDTKLQRSRMTILSFPSGETLSAFDLPGATDRPVFQWAPDGGAIHYQDSKRGVDNILAYDFRKGAVTPVTNFTSGNIYNFAWSPDGMNLAVARGQSTSDIVLLTISK